METLKIMACKGCLFVVEYGNEEWDNLMLVMGEEAGTKRYEEIVHSLEALGESVHVGDPDKVEEFSWRPCECCGLTLGGSRHELVVMRKEKEKENPTMAKMTRAGMRKLRQLQDAKDAAMNEIYKHGILEDLRFSDCCSLASEEELEAYREASRKLLDFQIQMVREGRAYWVGEVGGIFIPNS